MNSENDKIEDKKHIMDEDFKKEPFFDVDKFLHEPNRLQIMVFYILQIVRI